MEESAELGGAEVSDLEFREEIWEVLGVVGREEREGAAVMTIVLARAGREMEWPGGDVPEPSGQGGEGLKCRRDVFRRMRFQRVVHSDPLAGQVNGDQNPVAAVNIDRP